MAFAPRTAETAGEMRREGLNIAWMGMPHLSRNPQGGLALSRRLLRPPCRAL